MTTKTKKSATVTIAPTSDRFHPVTGTTLLALMRDLAHTMNMHPDEEEASIAREAMDQVAGTLMLVPPSTPEEALAAACFLYAEAGEIDDKKITGQDSSEPAWFHGRTMQRRAIALAAWIETAHGIDRKTYGLDHLCPQEDEHLLLPHSAPHPMSRPCVAPLRAGANPRMEAAE